MTYEQILRYLWPGVVALLLLNIAIGHARAGAFVKSGRITQEERQNFTRAAVTWSLGYCFAQEIVLLASHVRNPLCLLTFPPHTGYGVATWAVAVGTVALLLRLVWQDSAADVLMRVGPAYVNRALLSGLRPTRKQVQIILTVILVLALLANGFGSSDAPSMCGAPSAAA